MTPRIRVLVADDQAIVRDGLVTVLSLLPDIEVVGEAVNGEEAVRLVADLQPDVVLMDLRMPVLDGAAATARIVSARPQTAVLVLTTFADDTSIIGALRAGARGYLTKDSGRSEIATAIRATANGQATYAPEAQAVLIGSLTAASADATTAASAPTIDVPSRFPSLTPREAEALTLIADGLSNSEIAARMFVSVTTVKTYVNTIFSKLGLRDRAQAIALVRS